MNSKGGIMNRFEIDLSMYGSDDCESDLSGPLKDELSGLGMPFSVDERLLFWKHHFDEKDPNEFTVYANGHKKGGTLRFKDGHIRIPAHPMLRVYESKEYELGYKPRNWVSLDSILVCPAGELSQAELDMDGFLDHDDMIKSMKGYYPKIDMDSIVSFYTFGKIHKG
jgi:hypothetical protein